MMGHVGHFLGCPHCPPTGTVGHPTQDNGNPTANLDMSVIKEY